MNCYIISYDLRNERDYKSLKKAIRSLGKWARITDSTWAVVTDSSAVAVRDAVRSVMDNDDRLFVVRSGTEAAWRNSRCQNSWLMENL